MNQSVTNLVTKEIKYTFEIIFNNWYKIFVFEDGDKWNDISGKLRVD